MDQCKVNTKLEEIRLDLGRTIIIYNLIKPWELRSTYTTITEAISSHSSLVHRHLM